jgi:hypothetical protein
MEGNPYADLKRWTLKLHRESPTQSSRQPVVQTRDFLGRSSTREDDLPVLVDKELRELKELSLRLRSSCQEVKTVEEEDVSSAASLAEGIDAALFRRLGVLMGEGLCTKIQLAQWSGRGHEVTDRL